MAIAIADQLRQESAPHLLHNLGPVNLHRFAAQLQPISDLLIGQTLSNPLQNILLTRSQGGKTAQQRLPQCPVVSPGPIFRPRRDGRSPATTVR
ncbi:MAG: hypothetical protein U5O69_10835 [Candidatus Competibacteraceae bacterium]|nr:hypothetical protein [Candidatus Competibacteraceae bacterium]